MRSNKQEARDGLAAPSDGDQAEIIEAVPDSRLHINGICEELGIVDLHGDIAADIENEDKPVLELPLRFALKSEPTKLICAIYSVGRTAGGVSLQCKCRGNGHSDCKLWVTGQYTGALRVQLLFDMLVWSVAGRTSTKAEHKHATIEIKRRWGMKISS